MPSKVWLIPLSLAVAAAAGVPALNLTALLDQALHRAKALNPAFVGMQVVDLTTGKIIYQHNADNLFVPASNVKLFTTALALRRLGPQYRFQTSIVATRPPDASGRVAGDLVWIGSGDPSLSGREYPYRHHIGSESAISLAPIGLLADQIVAAGVREVLGDVIGDDSRYPYEPHPGGWSVADEQEGFGSPVSALVVNDNRFLLQLTPTGDGELADATTTGLAPAVMFVDNRVQTLALGKTDVQIERTGSQTILLTGVLSGRGGGFTEAVPVPDPAQSAAALLREALLQRGVNIHGRAIACHRYPGDPARPVYTGPVLARRTSPPLADILQVVDKVSQNLHAEILLREAGLAASQNSGTRLAGLVQLSAFLQSIGIDKNAFVIQDGSGLSRNTLVTPAAVVKLLAALYQSDQRELWMNLLPIGGVDGTLDKRFERRAEARRIQAKTGALSHVRALSGYAQTKDGVPLAFSFLINNFGAETQQISKFLDEAGLALLQ
jgi:serine-type D-Ala-D-Ala carboxypeptidase/endopeptidase (penicillin-binding protein 4)